MNTKTSFYYSLIALALWRNYSFGVITQIGDTNTIIAGAATNWNANNTLVLGNAGVVGGTHRINRVNKLDKRVNGLSATIAAVAALPQSTILGKCG